MREDQVRNLEEAIIDSIVVCGSGDPPCFEYRWLSHGALIVHCAIAKDKDWLRTNITSSEQLPKWRKAVIYVKSGRYAENRALSVQNGNLNAQGWKIIEYREDAGKGDSSLLVSMPEDQLQVLKIVNVRLLYGLGKAHCIVCHSPRAPTEPIEAAFEAKSTLQSEETKLRSGGDAVEEPLHMEALPIVPTNCGPDTGYRRNYHIWG